MTVWVVLGEFAVSEHGVTLWIEGVCKTRAGARTVATTAANGDEFKERKVLVDGIMLEGSGWTEEELEEEDETDWEVCFTMEEWEVQGA